MLEERIKPKEYGIEKDKELIDKWHEPTINPEAQDIKELEEDMMRIVISLYNPFTPGFRNRAVHTFLIRDTKGIMWEPTTRN